MKHNVRLYEAPTLFVFFVMSAAIALLASCSAEQTNTPNLLPTKEGKAYLEVAAIQPETSQTRITYAEDLSGTHPGMTAWWEPSEQLGVVSYVGDELPLPNTVSATDYLTSNNTTRATQATFAGTIATASTGLLAGRYNFYYPVPDGTIGYASGSTVTYDYTGQSCTLDASGTGDPDTMSSLDVLYTEQAADPAAGITLKRASTMLRFDLPLPQGTRTIQDVQLIATANVFYQGMQLTFNVDALGSVTAQGVDPTNSISTTIYDDTDDSSARTLTVYMLTPGGATIPQGSRLTVAATDVYGTTYTYSISDPFATAAVTLDAGKTYTFAPASPLSTDLSADGTANSYIIGGFGSTYSFDATVRGNGVTMSADFPAYFPTTIGKSRDYRPYVIWSMGGVGSSPAAADDVVRNVTYYPATGRIYFDAASAAQGGNAVIALMDEATGTIEWSWHIWMITTPKADQVYPTGIDYGSNITMMPYNLGAINTTGTTAAANSYEDGLLYQWGRKDPFPGGVGHSENNASDLIKGTHYYYDSMFFGDFSYDGAGPISNIRDTYLMPTTHYTGSSAPLNWSSTRYNALWGNPGTSTTWSGSNNSEYGIKTLFDPCPPGYKVPPPNTWSTGITDATGTWGNNGFTFTYDGTATTFYPTTGVRYSGGTLYGTSSQGFYWSSSPDANGSDYSRILHFVNLRVTSISSLMMERAAGLAVRCAQER
jgi:hypothetical protein